MMNKHIELIKKWLADPDSVTQQELDDNYTATKAAYYAVDFAVAYAAYATAYTYSAANSAAASDVDNAKHWVKRYEELTEQGE
jgi:hypothetical protein